MTLDPTGEHIRHISAGLTIRSVLYSTDQEPFRRSRTLALQRALSPVVCFHLSFGIGGSRQSHNMVQGPAEYTFNSRLRRHPPGMIPVIFLPDQGAVPVDIRLIRACLPHLGQAMRRCRSDRRSHLPWMLLQSRELSTNFLFEAAIGLLVNYLQDRMLVGGNKSDTFLDALEDYWKHPSPDDCCRGVRPLTLLKTLSKIFGARCFGCGEDAFGQFATFVLKHSADFFGDHAHWPETLRALDRMASSNPKLDMTNILSTAARHIPIDSRCLPWVCRDILSLKNRKTLQRIVTLSFQRSEIDLGRMQQRPRLLPSDRSLSSPVNFRPGDAHLDSDEVSPRKLLDIQRDNPGAIKIDVEALEPRAYELGGRSTSPPLILPALYPPPMIGHHNAIDRLSPRLMPLAA